MKKPILCDVDGVLCDFIGYCLNFSKSKGVETPEYSEIVRDSRKFPFWQTSGLDVEWSKEGFCSELPIIPGAQEFIQNLRLMDLHVIFVTSPPKHNKTWPFERTQWLEKNFGAKRGEVIFATDKRYVAGLTLIDDHEDNFSHWQEYNRSPAILVAQPWNSSVIKNADEHESGIYLDKSGRTIHRTNDFNRMLDFIRKIMEFKVYDR